MLKIEFAGISASLPRIKAKIHTHSAFSHVVSRTTMNERFFWESCAGVSVSARLSHILSVYLYIVRYLYIQSISTVTFITSCFSIFRGQRRENTIKTLHDNSSLKADRTFRIYFRILSDDSIMRKRETNENSKIDALKHVVSVSFNASAPFSLADFIQTTIGRYKCQNVKINIT